MRVIHCANIYANNEFMIECSYRELYRKNKEIKIWLKENQIKFHYLDSIGAYDRLVIEDENQALLFKLKWVTETVTYEERKP